MFRALHARQDARYKNHIIVTYGRVMREKLTMDEKALTTKQFLDMFFDRPDWDTLLASTTEEIKTMASKKIESRFNFVRINIDRKDILELQDPTCIVYQLGIGATSAEVMSMQSTFGCRCKTCQKFGV